MTFPKSSPIEALEARIAPAGIVNASFHDGELILSGDQDGSSFSFYNIGADTYVLDLFEGTTLVRDDIDSNVFEGPIKSFRWIGGSGNDEIILEGIQADGDVYIDAGDGENRVRLGGLEAGGNVVVQNSGSVDRLEMDGSRIEVAGDLLVNGGSRVYSAFEAYDSSFRIGGNMQIQLTGAPCNVYVEAEELLVEQNLFVETGDGYNLAYFYVQTLDVAGNLTLKNGEHRDMPGGSIIDAPFAHIGGDLTLFEGAGESGLSLSFEHLTIEGDLNISHAEGATWVGLGTYVESGEAPTSKLVVNGSLQVGMGDSQNEFKTYLSNLQVGGQVSIEGGNGDDVVNFLGSNLGVAKGISIDLHDGANQTDFAVENISVGKSLTVNGGSGADTLSISGEALVVNRSIVATMGEGSGSIGLASSYIRVGGKVQFVSGEHSGEEFTATLGSERLLVRQGIQILNGSGTNHTVIKAITSLNVAGGLKVVGGNELDALSVDALGTIKGGVQFTGGDGDNRFAIENDDMYSRTVSVLGDLRVNSTGNTEILAAGLAKVNGDVRLSLGSGTADVQVLMEGYLKVNGSFVILGEDTSLDSVKLEGLLVRDQTILRLGYGDTQVAIDDCLFRSSFFLATGAGNDSVTMEESDFDRMTTFQRNAVIRLGEGDDRVTIGGFSEFDQATFLARLIVNGGAGVDAVNDIENQNIFGPNAALILRDI